MGPVRERDVDFLTTTGGHEFIDLHLALISCRVDFVECLRCHNIGVRIRTGMARAFRVNLETQVIVLHYAITGHTAAEIISSRADHEKNNMGLQTWKNSPSGKILKSDTEIAKNYLDKEELDELNSLVNMYLDYAELQAKRQKLMYMDDWSQRLDGFLDFNEYDILENKGNISMKEAKEIANNEYDKFRPMQDKNYRSDFDKLLENIKEIK